VVVAGLFSAIGSVCLARAKKDQYTFIDKSVHHHTHKHEHRTISVIDDVTKKRSLELKDKIEKVFYFYL
jgi:hypothetical protein